MFKGFADLRTASVVSGYLAAVSERRTAGHIDGDRAYAVAEQRVDAASREQELESVKRSPVVASDAPATTAWVRYHCDGQNTTQTPKPFTAEAPRLHY